MSCFVVCRLQHPIYASLDVSVDLVESFVNAGHDFLQSRVTEGPRSVCNGPVVLSDALDVTL